MVSCRSVTTLCDVWELILSTSVWVPVFKVSTESWLLTYGFLYCSIVECFESNLANLLRDISFTGSVHQRIPIESTHHSLPANVTYKVPVKRNGVTSVEGNVLPGDSAILYCKQGYFSSGNTIVSCLGNGTLDRILGNCVKGLLVDSH